MTSEQLCQKCLAPFGGGHTPEHCPVIPVQKSRVCEYPYCNPHFDSLDIVFQIYQKYRDGIISDMKDYKFREDYLPKCTPRSRRLYEYKGFTHNGVDYEASCYMIRHLVDMKTDKLNWCLMMDHTLVIDSVENLPTVVKKHYSLNETTKFNRHCDCVQYSTGDDWLWFIDEDEDTYYDSEKEISYEEYYSDSEEEEFEIERERQRGVVNTHFDTSDEESDDDESIGENEINETPLQVKESAIVEDKCPICVEELTTCNHTVSACGHQFHTSCLIKWFSNKASKETRSQCPVCRKQMV